MNRIQFTSVVAMGCALLMPAPSMASQERLMTIGELRATSPGVGESGPVAVTATRGPHGFSAVEVQAFGRVTRLTADQLAQLHGQFVNGMQLSYEGGYKELGGRTVYIELLSQDVISGAQESQRISVNEQGAARVAPPSRGSH